MAFESMPVLVGDVQKPVTFADLFPAPQPEDFGAPASVAERFLQQVTPARAWIESGLHQAIEKASALQAEKLKALPEENAAQVARLFEAVRHAALLGGKRIRPLLSLMVGEALGLSRPEALRGICNAIELTHSQSLVFDDLPCMDDDVLRRGQPTLHVAFDEATAVLAADGLACYAFQTLVDQTPLSDEVQPQALLQVVKQLGEAASFNGLVNGQYADMFIASETATAATLRYIQQNKTGALIRFAICAPAVLSNQPEAVQTLLGRWADVVGQLFQVVDDLLDATASSEALGKTAGKDAAQEKFTVVQLKGLEGANTLRLELELEGRLLLQRLAEQGLKTDRLLRFQHFLANRER